MRLTDSPTKKTKKQSLPGGGDNNNNNALGYRTIHEQYIYIVAEVKHTCIQHVIMQSIFGHD